MAERPEYPTSDTAEYWDIAAKAHRDTASLRISDEAKSRHLFEASRCAARAAEIRATAKKDRA
jgi:hypothetical protein